MSLRVFAVVLDEPNDAAVGRLRDAYGNDFHPLNDTTALVRAEALSETIAVAAGIQGRDRIAGGGGGPAESVLRRLYPPVGLEVVVGGGGGGVNSSAGGR